MHAAHLEHIHRKYTPKEIVRCKEKVAYANRWEAEVARRVVRAKHGSEQYVYFCEICVKYHLTRNKRRRRG